MPKRNWEFETPGALIGWIKDQAVVYREIAVISINNNAHMNDLNGKCKLSQAEVDAILVDFVNTCAAYFGIDYALNTFGLTNEASLKLTDEGENNG
jgi:hypothetical protein